jgi:hypothetical protein
MLEMRLLVIYYESRSLQQTNGLWHMHNEVYFGFCNDETIVQVRDDMNPLEMNMRHQRCQDLGEHPGRRRESEKPWKGILEDQRHYL